MYSLIRHQSHDLINKQFHITGPSLMETVIILAIVMFVWQSKFIVMNFNFISCALRKISSKNCALAFMIFGTTNKAFKFHDFEN